MIPRRRTLLRTLGSGLVAATAATLLTTTVGAAPSFAENPITPGTFQGYGFDQCNAPRQGAMDAWRKSSPFRAVGIYISGNSRFCREQPNLTPKWVSNQLSRGWKLLPITLGPQASCSARFPRYGASIDPTIIPDRANRFGKARAQGAREAAKAVAEAKRLGIVPGSTLYYDLEGFDLNASVNCRNSAVWFLSVWTAKLHSLGYASGVYSSAGSGMIILDRARQSKPAHYLNPDQIWIARWDGKANTSTSYIPDTGWQHQRIKQYKGGHNETHGGVTINIDSNYLDVTTPKLGPTQPPATTGTTDAACTGDSISKTAYRLTSATQNKALTTSLQCLLKQQHLYNRVVTGSWNSFTTSALRAYQAGIDHPVRDFASRSDWVSLTYAGSANVALRLGDRGPDVIRLQRALNAATAERLPVTGFLNRKTRGAVRIYQRRVLGPTLGSGVLGAGTRNALRAGDF